MGPNLPDPHPKAVINPSISGAISIQMYPETELSMKVSLAEKLSHLPDASESSDSDSSQPATKRSTLSPPTEDAARRPNNIAELLNESDDSIDPFDESSSQEEPAQDAVPTTAGQASEPTRLDFLAAVAQVRSSSLGDSVADVLMAFCPADAPAPTLSLEPSMGLAFQEFTAAVREELGALRELISGHNYVPAPQTPVPQPMPSNPLSFSSIAAQQGGWATKRLRPSLTVSAPPSASVQPHKPIRNTVATRNPYAALAADSSSGGLSESEHRRVLSHESEDDIPLTAVFIMGINKPVSCSARFVSDYLHHERKFDRANSFNVSYLGESLSELVIPVDSVLDLEAALEGSSITLHKDFDPTTPLTPDSSSEKAREMFRNRCDIHLARLKDAPRSRRVRALTKFYTAYRETGQNTPFVATQSRRSFILDALRMSRPARQVDVIMESAPAVASTAPSQADVIMEPAPAVVSAASSPVDVDVEMESTPIGSVSAQGTDQ